LALPIRAFADSAPSFSFAATRFALGVALDRFGPKRQMLVCCVV
jgi:nitrate/nitrite transporter NarK